MKVYEKLPEGSTKRIDRGREMREIRLRVINGRTRDWQYGSSAITSLTITIYRGTCSRFLPLSLFWGMIEEGNWRGETVGEYTGLKDKNGKECYWDDIVNDGINPPFVITPDYHLLARLGEIEFEVIGNIYENPELLEEPRTLGGIEWR